MRDELARGALLRPLAQCAAAVLPVLGISHAAIAHYAWLVGFYSLARLEALDADVRTLYLLCFVQRRYLRLNDHVITCMLHLIKEYQDDATTAMQEHASALQSTIAKDLPKVGKVLKLLATPQHPLDTPLATLLDAVYAHVPPARLAELADYLLARGTVDDAAFYWATVDTLAKWAKTRLRPLLQALDLAATR